MIVGEPTRSSATSSPPNSSSAADSIDDHRLIEPVRVRRAPRRRVRRSCTCGAVGACGRSGTGFSSRIPFGVVLSHGMWLCRISTSVSGSARRSASPAHSRTRYRAHGEPQPPSSGRALQALAQLGPSLLPCADQVVMALRNSSSSWGPAVATWKAASAAPTSCQIRGGSCLARWGRWVSRRSASPPRSSTAGPARQLARRRGSGGLPQRRYTRSGSRRDAARSSSRRGRSWRVRGHAQVPPGGFFDLLDGHPGVHRHQLELSPTRSGRGCRDR